MFLSRFSRAKVRIVAMKTPNAPRNTICIWYDKDALKAAKFYASLFPDSRVTAVHKAPSDFPSGKKGQVLTVEC